MVRVEKLSTGYSAAVELLDDHYDVLIVGYGDDEAAAVKDLAEHLGDIQLSLARFTGGLVVSDAPKTSH